MSRLYSEIECSTLLDNKNEFTQLIGNYDSPRGEKQFIKTLAEFFNRNYDWGISRKNIVLTSGSQMGYFLLFNSFAGDFLGGAPKTNITTHGARIHWLC